MPRHDRPREPRPNPDLAKLRGTWSRVVEHLPDLRKHCHHMSKVDVRLDENDLLARALAEIGQSEHLYQPERASWLTWAKTQVWKARTLELRELNKHAPRGRGGVGSPPRDGNEHPSDLVEPAVGVGSEGHHDRAEARIALEQLLEDALDDEREALLLTLQDWSPELHEGGAEGAQAGLASLRKRSRRSLDAAGRLERCPIPAELFEDPAEPTPGR